MNEDKDKKVQAYRDRINQSLFGAESKEKKEEEPWKQSPEYLEFLQHPESGIEAKLKEEVPNINDLTNEQLEEEKTREKVKKVLEGIDKSFVETYPEVITEYEVVQIEPPPIPTAVGPPAHLPSAVGPPAYGETAVGPPTYEPSAVGPPAHLPSAVSRTKKEKGARIGKSIADIGKRKATKKIVKGVSSKVGATLGSAIPVVGTAIGHIAGQIVGDVLADPVGATKKWGKRALVAAAAIIGAVTAWVAGLVVSTIVNIIIAIILFIFAVAIILFIINSGAYIVPPGGLGSPIGSSVESQYIRVAKEANPHGPLSNISKTIQYSITITALQGALDNITFSESCNVVADYSRDCPSIENIEAGSQGNLSLFGSIDEAIPITISPTTSYIIVYERKFNGGTFDYPDSFVTDTFTVSADASGKGSSASGSAGICFGDCPMGCFEIVKESSWPSSYLATINSAIASLVSNHPNYIAKVCSGPQIPLCYDPAPHSFWGCHNSYTNLSVCKLSISHYSSCDIIFFSGGLGNQPNAEYILAHEAGHHLDDVMPSIYVAYIDYPPNPVKNELPLCSYSSSSIPSEGFAEGIALYVQQPSFWSSAGYCTAGTTYPSLYPAHYKFAKEVVFEE